MKAVYQIIIYRIKIASSMGNINVAVIGEKGYGRKIGKKGTQSDITFYNLKKGENTVTIIEPTGYPEKFSPLYYSLSISDIPIFVASSMDAYFGEALLAAWAMEKNNAIFIGEENILKEMIKEIDLKAMFFSDEIELREYLIREAERRKAREKENGTVVIDHFFNVRGVGTVILGTVVRGSVRKHDDLKLLPLNRDVHVRSIQKHDDDFGIANEGDRVGIALKGVDTGELKRGYVLTSEELEMEKEIDLEIERNKYWNGEIKEDAIFHIGFWMQFMPARYKNKFIFDKPIVFLNDSNFFISHLDSKVPRVVGKGKIKQHL